MEIIDWIKKWYLNHCDGDWEHNYGITIQTIDNPGWEVMIDLKETEHEDLICDNHLQVNSDNDWYSYKIENSKFIAYGDPEKLDTILIKFKELIDNF